MPVYTDGSKLYATHIAELHEFAGTIGLTQNYYVEQNGQAYYYIGGGNIALLKAIAGGAICIRKEQLVFKKRKQLQPPKVC